MRGGEREANGEKGGSFREVLKIPSTGGGGDFPCAAGGKRESGKENVGAS